MPQGNYKICLKVFVDLLILTAVALPVLILYLVGQPFYRGFFCNDTTIRYPYKESTVTSGALYAIGTIIPISFIAIIEYVHVWKGRVDSQTRDSMRLWFWSMYQYIGVFLFGCALSHLTVDLCKYSIGRLRPHFIDVCKPDWEKVDCSSMDFITDENMCTNSMNTPEETLKMREARLSFISGHASFSAYTMFYLIIYLQARFRLQNFPFIRPLFQYIFFGITVYTSLSRISDNKHHWSDVLVGFINGTVFAFFMTLAVAGLASGKHSVVQASEIKMASFHRSSDTQDVIEERNNGRHLNA